MAGAHTEAASVSVVIPVYNGADRVAGAIESVLAQSRAPTEVVVVDDGSTDATPDALRAFGAANLRVIRTANDGEASARNVGIDETMGDFVAFLDHDDTWRPDKLARQLATFDPSWGMSFTAYERRTTSAPTIARHDHWDPDARAVLGLLGGSCAVGPPSTVMIRRDVLRTVGGFQQVTPFGDDWLMWLRIAAAGHRIGYVPEPLTSYEWHGANMSNDERGYFDAACAVFDAFGDRRLRARWRLLAAIDAFERGERSRARRRVREGARIRPWSVRPGWARYLR